MNRSLFVLPVLVLAGAALPPSAKAQGVGAATAACRAGSVLRGDVLAAALGRQGFRMEGTGAGGSASGETVFLRNGRTRLADGGTGTWELTDGEGLMTGGPGGAESYHEVRRHAGMLWACPAGGRGTARRIQLGAG